MKSTDLDDLQVNIDEILQEYDNETNSVSLSLKLNISLDGNNVSKNISISPSKKDKENSIKEEYLMSHSMSKKESALV